MEQNQCIVVSTVDGKVQRLMHELIIRNFLDRIALAGKSINEPPFISLDQLY